LIALATQTDRIDPARDRDGNRLEHGHVVGQKTTAAGQTVDLDGESGHVRCGHHDSRPIAGHDDRGSAVIGPRVSQLAPRDTRGAQGRRQRHAEILKERRHIVMLLNAPDDVRAQRRIVRSFQHDSIDEPRGGAAQKRIEQRRCHPQRHEDAELPRVYACEL
jgi:hypothetical protein